MMPAVGEIPTAKAIAPFGAAEGAGFGPTLALWTALLISLHLLLWVTGFRGAALGDAVEQGAARAEALGIGEVSDDLIRKAIRTQHETLPFWTTITLIDDFLVEPLALAVRALVVATVFSAIAALAGRSIQYDRALAAGARAQGFWVLGVAVQTGLMIALRRKDVEISPALLLPRGTYPAALWLALRQCDPFTVLGWSALARGGWRRGQVGLAAAVIVVLLLALGEAALRISAGLAIGSAMRLEAVTE